MNRRRFLTGLASALAAPAVVRSGILMPLRGIVMPPSLETMSFASSYPGGFIVDTLTMDHIKAAVEMMSQRRIPPIMVAGKPYYGIAQDGPGLKGNFQLIPA